MAFKKFIPITKVDAVKRLVYGTATAEQPDRVNEVCDYESTKPYYQEWSSEVAKASDGKSFGNVRAMHGTIAAGKLTSITFDDDNKQVEVVAKVVDDAEWNKVEEGVYTGFSQGGKYIKRWKDPSDPTLTRYTASPCEISLVDLPMLPSATFDYVKADGSSELRKFSALPKEPTNDEVAARATELAKAAGDEKKWPDQIEAARALLTTELNKGVEEGPGADDPPVEDLPPVAEEVAKAAAVPTADELESVEQVWRAKDGTTYKKKADAIAANRDAAANVVAKTTAQPALDKLDQIKDALAKTTTAEVAAVVEPAAVVEVATAVVETAKPAEVVKTAETTKKPRDFVKGLWTVARFAELVESVTWLAGDVAWEQLIESDASGIGAELKAWALSGADLLTRYLAQEVAELNENFSNDVDVITAAAKPVSDRQYDALVKAVGGGKFGIALRKAGARNSKSDASKIQAMHDNSVDLGASCGDDAEKMLKNTISQVTAERDALTKQFAAMTPILAEVLERVKQIEAQPMAGPMRTTLVEKVHDGLPSLVDGVDLANATPDQMAVMLIKAAQRNGQSLNNR